MQSDVEERKCERLDEADLQIRGARENLKAAAVTLRPAKGTGNLLKLLSSCQRELNEIETQLNNMRHIAAEPPHNTDETPP